MLLGEWMSGAEVGARGPASKSQSRKLQSFGSGNEDKWAVETEWTSLTTVDAGRGVF